MIQLFKNLKSYRKMIFFVIGLIFLQTIADLFLPTLMAFIVDVGIVSGDIPYILKLGSLMLLIAGVGVACSIAASFFSARVAIGFGKNLREQLFSKTTNFSMQQFNEIGTASLITRTTNDITQLQQVLVVMMRMMVMAPLMCIGGVIMALSRDVKLSLIFLAVIPLLALAIVLIVTNAMPLFKALQKKLDKLNLIVRENLTGIRVVRAFNRIDYEQERFDDANIDIMSTAVKVNRIMSLLMPTMMITLNFSIVAIVWFGSIRIDNGNMLVGDLMAFIQYATLIMFSLVMMSMMFVLIPRAQVSAERINEVLQMEDYIFDGDQDEAVNKRSGEVEFKNVSFSYPGAEQAVLSNISFSSKKGEVTAIIGGTGSGKSTLVQLIQRFYEVDSGAILINGLDLRKMTQRSLREKIGYVPQKSLIFSGTIADNIRYGNEQASDEEVFHAAKIAQASQFINELDGGFQAELSQAGANLSGGQRQRLAIARALVRKAEIYIFDDSFSALDYKTDAQLRLALKDEIVNSIVIIVAQRVSTVIDADKIIVLHEGKIVGNGRHEDLIESNEVYKEIVASQMQGEVIP